jgi:adenylate cyclase, class 2
VTDENLEVEVKFLVTDLAAARQRLLEAGAIPHKARTYEYNIRYDNAWNGLLRQGKLLRLRRDQQSRLTFKGVSELDLVSEAKVRQEIEIEVSEFEATAMILERIGFERRQVYEKYRETFRLGEVEITLDEMPFGHFVELEGGEDGIRQAAAALGLDWQKRVLDNYLALMARLKASHGLDFDDLTFDNFRGRERLIFSMLEAAG